MNDIEKLIEKILSHFAGKDFVDELEMAKKEFFDHVIMDPDRNDQYELRMNQFFDWYFFSRKLSNFGQTPLEACLLVRELRFVDSELALLNVLKKNVHSLFEFAKIKGKDVYIQDIIKNNKIVVKDSNVLFGFNEEEIFEARLVQFDGKWIFLKGFCFHPFSVKKIILTEVKKFRKNTDLDPESFIFRLMKMRYKFEQYKHVKPEMIYSQEVLA
ncbi:MAG: hypothetical protein JNL11_16880 [Bdellovibrionaceae bacterium]|nr:hypothetical protein [Pseudobdellovibrionaceae bacterium]